MNDSLGDRMKGYEESFKLSLPKRMPVIVRLDGKAFHTLTRNLKKPFDDTFNNLMLTVSFKLCEEVQNCVLAYTQSDEISLLLVNDKNLDTESWFGNQLQKIVSVSAGIASAYFSILSIDLFQYHRTVVFDSRAFILPQNEVNNYFVWRQQDASRNSIQAVAQSLYSPKELHGKKTPDLHELLYQKNINWNDVETKFKRGVAIKKMDVGGLGYPIWITDYEIPIFSEDPNYIQTEMETIDG